jgi:hypothetical protein
MLLLLLRMSGGSFRQLKHFVLQQTRWKMDVVENNTRISSAREFRMFDSNDLFWRAGVCNGWQC